MGHPKNRVPIKHPQRRANKTAVICDIRTRMDKIKKHPANTEYKKEQTNKLVLTGSSPGTSDNSFMYEPPQSIPFWYFTSYL